MEALESANRRMMKATYEAKKYMTDPEVQKAKAHLLKSRSDL